MQATNPCAKYTAEKKTITNGVQEVVRSMDPQSVSRPWNILFPRVSLIFDRVDPVDVGHVQHIYSINRSGSVQMLLKVDTWSLLIVDRYTVE